MYKLKLSILLVLISCNSGSFNPDKAREELLHLNNLQQRAHLEGNADLLTSIMTDSLMTVQGGIITFNSREEIKRQFENNFSRVTYKKWDDISDPIIEISGDGSMATMTVNKEIELAPVVDDSVGNYSTTTWAWSSFFRKEDGEWKMYGISSSQVPEEN